MKKKIIIGVIVGAFLMSGCGAKFGAIKYSEYNAYSQNLGGNRKYKEIAPIRACAKDYAWVSCNKTAKDALKELQTRAKVIGGNGVIYVRWLSPVDSSYTSLSPVCVQTMAAWQEACVEGVAVKFLDNNETK